MQYAEVAVNSPRSRGTFCYAIPSHLNVHVGSLVWVPFGSRVAHGVVVQINSQPSVKNTKEITCCTNDYPLLSLQQIELAYLISRYYLSSLYDAFALMFPPEIGRRPSAYFEAVEPMGDVTWLTKEQGNLLNIVMQKGKVSLKELVKEFGRDDAEHLSSQLFHHRLLTRKYEFPQISVKPQQVDYVSLKVSNDEAENEIKRLGKVRAHKQIAVLEFLLKQSEAISTREMIKKLKCSIKTVQILQNRQLLSVNTVNVRRNPLSYLKATTVLPPALTTSQHVAWKAIETEWDDRDNPADPLVFLLLGITGSGKTEIYLRALDKVVARGKRGICLVPEIALTAQTVDRFAGRYPGKVGILHSGLSAGEQYDEWQRIKEGKCDVVIGTRSALFAPQPDLGLIIIDEEHERMYKQEDRSPRYHAREVAILLAQLNNAVVFLGSATPDVASFYMTQLGKYRLITLPERVIYSVDTQQAGNGEYLSSPSFCYATLPEVKIVDMRNELREGNTSIISRSLLAGIEETLQQDDQVILFLNRRGTANFVQCPNCGFIFRCPHCSVALTYHSHEERMICHHCHYSISVPLSCPQCSSVRLIFLGMGTQKVVDEVRKVLPNAKLLRCDSDVVAGRKHKHEAFLTDFRSHKADILIGTQMIAKGLDLPKVALAGIISADTSINLPDFRAEEQTFQLLCRVAGWSGRGFKAGKVIIQTYSPDNYAIKAAARHDYLGFYRDEINYRRQYNYPPFSQLIRLVYSHTNIELCQREVKRLSQSLSDIVKDVNDTELSLIGPMPTFISRLRGRYRWQIILCGSNVTDLLSNLNLPAGWDIDVDPVRVS
jgi:primosomal protein N' (replication factor Y) (superfamily II helicase)